MTPACRAAIATMHGIPEHDVAQLDDGTIIVRLPPVAEPIRVTIVAAVDTDPPPR